MNNYKKRKVLLAAEAGIVVDDNIYFFSLRYNLLYKVHMPDFSVSIISQIPYAEMISFAWFRNIEYYDGKLIFIPEFAKKVWLYDIKEKRWDSITIDNPNLGQKFWGSTVYYDSVFLFGEAYPAIVKINLNDYSIVNLNIEYDFKLKKARRGREGFYLTNVVRVGNTAFSPVSISNYVLRLNLDTFEYEWLQVGNVGNQYSGIDYDGDNFWISSGSSGNIVKWDGKSKWEEFEVPIEIAKRPYQFIGVLFDENKIRFLTQQRGRSLEIRKKDNGVYKVYLTEVTENYIHLKRYENGIITLMKNDALMDVKWKGKWVRGVCAIAHEELKGYFKTNSGWDNLIKNNVVNESHIISINDFIEVINESAKDDKASREINIGNHIWEREKSNV